MTVDFRIYGILRQDGFFHLEVIHHIIWIHGHIGGPCSARQIGHKEDSPVSWWPSVGCSQPLETWSGTAPHHPLRPTWARLARVQDTGDGAAGGPAGGAAAGGPAGGAAAGGAAGDMAGGAPSPSLLLRSRSSSS